MTRTIPFLLISFACLPRADAALEVAAPSCEDLRGGIRAAPYADAARVAIREYLHCVEVSPSPPPDLQTRIRTDLEHNPYPAVTRRDDVYGYFFDMGQLRALPPSPAAMPAYITQLEDQSLARSALGEKDVADAARTRAERLRRLQTVLDGV